VDLTFRGGEHLRIGPDWQLEILHLPGHSRGHLGVWDLKYRILFGGDAIHGAVYLGLNGQPALCPTYLQIDTYRATIRFIEHLPLDAYCGCHWPVKRGSEIREFCEESRAFVEHAERLILEALCQPKTLNELCTELGPKLGTWPRAVNSELCYAFVGHLNDLEARGCICRVPGRKPHCYERTGAT
jgi:glyoxylase-like metal-dependent hydrolase (beta-lactamase superfamily II)